MTRADFYLGRGKKAVWIGSVNHDGYPSGWPEPLLDLTSKREFEKRFEALAKRDRDGTVLASDGWPWPWPSSDGTDYVYAFDDGCVWVHGCSSDGMWVRIDTETKKASFPRMTPAPGKEP